MDIHPQSFRALAIEIRHALSAEGITDDTRLRLPIIEQQMRHALGSYYDRRDRERENRGEEPEAERITTFTKPLTGDELLRSVDIPGLLQFMGRPYVMFVGAKDAVEGFTPADYRWQLAALAELGDKPAYCIEGEKLWVQLTKQTALVEELRLVGALANTFPEAGRADDWYWKQAWTVAERVKDSIKMSVVQFLMGTHFQLQPRNDTKNNGTEG